jgi:translation initiation factor 4G
VTRARRAHSLIDVLELRKNGWQTRRKVEGPTTIEEVHEEAERKDAEDARASRVAVGGGGRGGGGNQSRRGGGMQGAAHTHRIA